MAKNSIHFNEFNLEIINGVYQLKCVEPFKKRLPVYDEESVWKFITKRDLESKSIMKFVRIFFISDNNKVKGFYETELITFHGSGDILIPKIVLMANVQKIVFVMKRSNSAEDIMKFPKTMTDYYQNKLNIFQIEIIDTLVISNEKCFSLKENSLI
ncbi:hypothetical protein [Flavobacterium sp.]|uniref:hypothetical protein n=1 Tax=Flavobacterium sp. TaxID=239 RepID=UPI003F69F3F6